MTFNILFLPPAYPYVFATLGKWNDSICALEAVMGVYCKTSHGTGAHAGLPFLYCDASKRHCVEFLSELGLFAKRLTLLTAFSATDGQY